MISESHIKSARFFDVFRHELKVQFKSRATWLCFVIMTLMTFRYLTGAYWDELVGSGQVPVNSPTVIYYINAFMSFWVAVLGVGFMTSGILRDLRYHTAPIIYSLPVSDKTFLFGRYLASMLVYLFVFTSIIFGFWLIGVLGPIFQFNEAHSFMPTPWAHLFHAYLVFIVPSVFCFGTIHFCMASLSGKVNGSYVLIVIATLLFLAFEIGFGKGTSFKYITEIIDPMAFSSVESQLIYWSVEERKTAFVTLDGVLLWNRVFYIAIGIFFLALLFVKFNLRGLLGKNKSRSKEKTKDILKNIETYSANETPEFEIISKPKKIKLREDVRGYLALSFCSGLEEIRLCTKTAWFRLMMFFNFLITLTMAGTIYQAPEGNLRASAVDVLGDSLQTYVLVGVMSMLFTIGEVFARERTAGISNLIDSTPVPSWALMLGKILAALLCAIIFTLLPLLATLTSQILDGYFAIEWSLYGYAYVMVLLPSFVTFALLCAAIHIIVNNKFIGHILSLIGFMTVIMLREVEVVESPLALIGMPFLPPLSAFDIYAQFVEKFRSLNIYYIGIGILIVLLASFIWPRGAEISFKKRVMAMRINIGKTGAVLAAILVVMLSGKNVKTGLEQSHYAPTHAQQDGAAAYEKKYGDWLSFPHPKITQAVLDVTILGEQRYAKITGELSIVNTTDQLIEDIYLSMAEFTTLNKVEIAGIGLQQLFSDPDFGQYQYRLDTPLPVGASTRLSFDMDIKYTGYDHDNDIHGNVFADNSLIFAELLPQFGFDAIKGLETFGQRKFYGLPNLMTQQGRNGQGVWASHNADKVTVDLTIRSDKGLEILSSGEMVYDGEENGLRVQQYIHADGLWNFGIAIANYDKITREIIMSGQQEINVEIYHHPDHGDNALKIFEASSYALARYYKQFGPLKYSTIRIAEVANGTLEAARVAGNVIFIPERQAWLHAPVQEGERDWIQFLIAQKIAEMYWGEHLVPSDLPGQVFLTKSIALYLALESIGSRDGVEQAQAILDMHRMLYLKESAKEVGAENPVIHADTQQDYYINKGVLVLQKLKTVLGGDFNTGLSIFYQENVDGVGGFSNITSLYNVMKAQARSVEDRVEIERAFTSTDIFDLQVRNANVRSDDNGEFIISVDVSAKHYMVVSGNNRKLVDMDQNITIALISAQHSKTEMQTIHLKNGINRLSLKTKFRPDMIQIDPNRTLIDMEIRDNQFALNK